MNRIPGLYLACFLLLFAAACQNLSVVPDAPSIVPVAHPSMPSHDALRAALKSVVEDDNGGFALHMWATTLDREGRVTNVAFSGNHWGEQWPGSRVISAQKANTANAFSLPGLALSSANLFAATQPGGSLSGLQFSNPINTDAAYGGNAANYGTPTDYMRGKKIGGVNIFVGGLALYTSQGELIGALGVSGDSSCADHNIAWKLRDALNLDFVPAGVSATGDDNIVYDIVNNKSTSEFGHPVCNAATKEIGEALPQTHPLGQGVANQTSVAEARVLAADNLARKQPSMSRISAP